MTIATFSLGPTTASRPVTVETHAFAGGVTGGPRILLRLEGAALLAASVLAYAHLGGGWGMFALLFFLPDVSMLGYLVGPSVGAALYNTGHSTLAPASLVALGFSLDAPLAVLIGVIWLATSASIAWRATVSSTLAASSTPTWVGSADRSSRDPARDHSRRRAAARSRYSLSLVLVVCWAARS